MMKLVSLLLAVLAALPLTGALSEGAPVSVMDMTGREITLPAPATRIVALTASDCEILCALGAEDALVGRGEYCDYPETIADVPVVQSGAETNVEQIVALAPQLVLTATMAQTIRHIEMLEAAGIKAAASNAENIEGVYASIRLIGALTGRNHRAETLIADMEAAFSDIAARSENSVRTVYFEVSPLAWGLWTAGSGTFMSELAEICGLTNAFADLSGWAEISEEQVLERDPDYIVTIAMDSGEGPSPTEEIKARAGWGTLKAVRNDAILHMDSDAISRPGPRLKDAAETLFDFIHTR